MKDAPLLHRAEYGAFLALRGLLRASSHAGARHAGAALGEACYLALVERRRLTHANLALAFPETDPGQRRRWARQSFRSLGAQLGDALSAPRLDAVELCRRWRLEGWEHLEARSPDGASFLMSAHLGFWEIPGQAVALYKGGFLALSRPLDNPHLERQLRASRQRFGVRMVPKQGAARAMVAELRSGGRVFLLIDQRPGREEAVEVPFFGRPARTTPVLARLARRFEVPVVPLFGFPRPGGRYLVAAREPIAPEEGEDEIALTARYLAAVEAEVRRQPGLWMWMHRRWRTG